MEKYQKIIPNLWFDGNADEAVDFYFEVFENSKELSKMHYPTSDLPDFQKDMTGKVLTINFILGDLEFIAINAGPEFKPNPSMSFMVRFDQTKHQNARDKLNETWKKLSEDGKVLMDLQKYSFSEYFGWVEDKYGFSWQLILGGLADKSRPFIIPSRMFGSSAQNKAHDAIEYYVSVFKDSGVGQIHKYPEPTGPATTDSIMFADFKLAGQWFMANDSGANQNFTFNEAVSYMIKCRDQAEIDYFWGKLSASSQDEQCGWCKDKFGISWQVVPEDMEKYMQQSPNSWKKLMNMKKIVLDEFSE